MQTNLEKEVTDVPTASSTEQQNVNVDNRATIEPSKEGTVAKEDSNVNLSDNKLVAENTALENTTATSNTTLVPTPASNQQQQIAIPTTTTTTTAATTVTTATLTPVDNAPVEQPVINRANEILISKIKQKREIVKRLDEELYFLRHYNADLIEKEKAIQERMVQRKKDQQQLLINYNEHIRSRRATDDDPATIRTRLLELKAMIKDLSLDLASQCDPKVASAAIGSFWINLNEAIAKLGDPIPMKRIVMLTEKFLMDVLVQSMNYNTFPGLKISQPYTQLQFWFDRYDPAFCTRLRQEVAKTVVAGNTPNSDIQADITKFNKRMYNSLYSSLLKAYPFMDQHDSREQDSKKRYSTVINKMVELASYIGYAIRGQEVEIAAAAVGEGSEPLDLKTMNDEDNQTSGIIQFCVCPPFVVYGSRIEVLEKARVLCSPLPANYNKQ
ncbi:hypothetical protein BCV72DRAFT_72236 [Rhizopus microsporus var. microsporus]|uniref:Uncharacterized protein n=2 Tax=Rhizopus microsporus TaxID=58291 RepID=A0A2G4SL32_RHIZD|nr:uncharacterized protein RHIMIDRAFT_48172 [Rhizopus microsporus ATCC 52813]ORE01521.1 hypothetical protein BCV72DRAFT_72236 [Rhizopus microsporus var. microsporus]PHZ09497.1 hypothetical protein RHIMIDRAFT_48172 [Rhizopus microsporus ATCC 52813]